jgi:hypothetical protein
MSENQHVLDRGRALDLLRCIVSGAALFSGDGASAAAEGPRPQTVLRATTVYRGLEEPGRYDVANLFDGDGGTSYCGTGPTHVTVTLSFADAAVLTNLTGVRFTPSHNHTARRLAVWFHYRGAGGAASRKVEAALGTEPETLAFVDVNTPSPNGTQVDVYLDGDKATGDRRPICLADLGFVGRAGKLDLPDLPGAIKAVAARDAQLAPLTNDRGSFARVYLTSFDWVWLDPHGGETNWDSSTYRFRADGTYESKSYDMVDVPVRGEGRWSVDGNRTVMIDGRRHKLVPCSRRRGYLCLSEKFFPIAAW